jgi:hypothetical protein
VAAREDFGAPTGEDLLIAVGEVYLRRGQLPVAVRALLSAASEEVAEGVLEAVLIDYQSRHD